ncbi:RNA-directed DNA polymerase [Acinetobacter sp. ANC 3789]
MTLDDKDLITDIYIAYAWKKAQAYITSTNWYADNLEIKLSSLKLENTIATVKKKINIKREKFKQLQLVPVPKGTAWDFIETNEGNLQWQPKELEKQKLRPLAHISIYDQIVMILIMMGLANKVESIQGDPNTSFQEVHNKKVVSYGNRLYCNYINDIAYFNYYAENTYSKYFVDYQKFLKRPQHFGEKNIGKISPDEQLFILELDIEKFFDNIDRELLLNKIIEIKGDDGGIKLNNILRKFKDWDWDDISKKKFKDYFLDEKIPYGIPQGLVAAGFLSNIYLLKFDEEIIKKINKNIGNSDIKLIDYCRYVDDIRIVVNAKNKENKFKVLEAIQEEINKYLIDIKLNINGKKSKIDSFIVSKGNISTKISNLKNKLSGPIPFEDAEDQLGHLEALLNLTREEEEKKDFSLGQPINSLQQIDKHYFDLREDTVKRFSANQISKILSEIRHNTSQEVDLNGIIVPGEWDYVQERIARRFISIWAKDPSTTLLLKKAVELFPDKRILKPILLELENLRKCKNNKVLNVIADYCLAELFRHSSTIIHNKERLSFPAHCEIDGFFELLQSFAAKLMNEIGINHEYNLLLKQAEYLLLVRLDSTLENKSNNPINDFIFKICNGFRKISVNKLSNFQLALSILLAYNIYIEESKFYRALSEFFQEIYKDKIDFKEIIEIIINENYQVVKDLYFYAKNIGYDFVKSEYFNLIVENYNFKVLPLSGNLEEINGSNSLLKIILRKDNPFSNEIMILKLFQEIIKSPEIIKGLKPNQFIDFAKTNVQFKAFSSPLKYNVFNEKLTINIHLKEESENLIYKALEMEKGTLHKIATFIRSVIVGQEDWALSRGLWIKRAANNELNSSSIRRRLSVWSSPEHLLGEGAQVSNWLTDLLTKLLQINFYKPYKNIHNWPNQLTLSNLDTIIQDRLKMLSEYYCQLSGTPTLIERVDLGWKKDKKNLTVAMVQSKMPRVKDIRDYGLYLNNKLYRPQHRKHITRVCKLIQEHVKAQKIYEPLEKSEPNHNHIDILVWPELAVHKDDLDVLINLSRKTKSIIYAGLTYIDQPNIDGPNNCAIWIVPNIQDTNQVEIKRLQGKKHMMALERSIKPWRPYQLILELIHPAFPNEKGFMISGSICYDATDIALSSDLRDKTNAYFISALNKDINTFDSMVEALHYHMFQHVVLVNSGEYGGSYAKAPYKDHYCRLISHVHGNNQVSISTFEMNMFDFRRDNVGSSMRSGNDLKATPAGLIKN